MVYVLIANGVEEIEALTVVDLLRRADLNVKMASIADMLVTGSNGITIQADMLLGDVALAQCEMLVLPGGGPGTKALYANSTVCDMTKQVAEDLGKYLAAICAAPSIILGGLGLLQGKKATCYVGMEDGMVGATPVEADFVRDGNIITGRGVGGAIPFALELIRVLCGDNKAEKIAKEVVFYG